MPSSSRRAAARSSRQPAAPQKRIYLFGDGKADGNAKMKDLLGGKGANLAEMAAIGLPVPPGFTITTEMCDAFFRGGNKMPAGLEDETRKSIAFIEKSLGRTFGKGPKALLVSIRSGAAASMPGMMDTVLNLGLNEQTVAALIKETANTRFVYDSYRRFITMYGDVVMHADRKRFEHEFEALKKARGYKQDTDATAEDLQGLCEKLLRVYRAATGEDFPQDPWQQLETAIEAVFRSWNNPRAIEYRRLNRVVGLRGTAVNVQAMVFGNLDDNSATGVGFTRDPSTGENTFFCDVLFKAQGEDVVAGIRTPLHLDALKAALPQVHAELFKVRDLLERHQRDMQDIEFTIQSGKLYLLQCRNGKRTAKAALKIAIDLVNEKLLTREEALLKIDASSLNQLLHPTFDPRHKAAVLAEGVPASPGAAVGRVVFSSKEAEERAVQGEKVILVRHETSADDIRGMALSEGFLTARGGRTSHAAVVARQMGKVCVSGCGAIEIDEPHQFFSVRGQIVRSGDIISIDGGTGKVMLGEVPRVQPRLDEDFATIMHWADDARTLKVRANADTPADARKAREFGAQGIGLCRTEHMFFDEGRINKMREMILAKSVDGRRRALAKLEPMQREDFFGLFKAMDGLPVTIRLLDPPLHEFLPLDARTQERVAEEIGVQVEEIQAAVSRLHESNPMLGLRGCRLGLLFPEVYEMQARAIAAAALEAVRHGIKALPELMIPLVGHVEELRLMRDLCVAAIKRVQDEQGLCIEIPIGTMIEVPRAALTADKVAEQAEFFSFGTNDLTQMTLGVSRDDAEGGFLVEYVTRGIYPVDPFATIDRDGVGKLMKMGKELGRAARPGLKIGICGEHGGDPESIALCHELGFDYVSCSPYRLPIARLAAAQAALK
ncbi:MAG: pyruvate, phosphate dikinase [Planctomycetota bacterium]|nr:pyruvate, phosphate dikinase [Planctomycetota bacterium]GIK53139.1 MAG: pyruvate, phosphate dikinase [Planctomycetota bacterium]